MHSAGARALRGDDNEMSREAVLLQWERKIEAAERLDGDSRRFVRTPDAEPGTAEPAAAEPVEDTAPEPAPLRVADDPQPARRFERSAPGAERGGSSFERSTASAQRSAPSAERTAPSAQRRTITITGQPTPARRRRPVVDAQLAQPDRIALWAFLLGLLLVAVAAGTAHA